MSTLLFFAVNVFAHLTVSISNVFSFVGTAKYSVAWKKGNFRDV